MGQSSSAPMRSHAKDVTNQQASPETYRDSPSRPEDLADDFGNAPEDEPSVSSGIQGIRRRRSTAGGLREFKRQRPHLQDEDSASSSVSSVSSSYGSFETARSQASVHSNQTNSNQSSYSSHSSHSSRSRGENTLRRLTNHVRSVFSSRSSTSNAEETQEPPSGFVNTAVPGTPGILENVQAPPYEPSPPPAFTETPQQPSLPLLLPSTPAPAYTHSSENFADQEPRVPNAEGPNSDPGQSISPDEPDSQGPHDRRPGHGPRDETTQVEMLSRVLLAAASLTALRLVGSHFGRGELYGGSSEAAAMRRRAQAEIDARRNQRRQEEGENNNNDATDSPEMHQAHLDANRAEEQGRSETPSDDFPRELTFAAFLEQLRTGQHSEELSNTMFGSPDSNFFRLFRFQQDPEGRVPVLLMGIRAAERGSQALGDEQRDEAAEAQQRDSHVENSPHNESDVHHDVLGNTNDLDFNMDRPNPDNNFSGLDGDFRSQSGFNSHTSYRENEDSDDQGDEHDGENIYEQHDTPENSDPIFDEDYEADDDENPFSPDRQHPGEGARLLNSLMSGLTGIDPGHAHQHDEDAWFRPRNRRPSASQSSSEDTDHAPPRQHQSWVIYVIGGLYPPTHPIFFAPSLMTDNPTYEDLLIVEDLLGPVKPPVATRSDLDSAGGTFPINRDSELLNDRCPVCLMDYQENDMCRTLKCDHTFHQECVDSWLTRSHNTCPMCRTKGVPSSDPTRPERAGFAAA